MRGDSSTDPLYWHTLPCTPSFAIPHPPFHWHTLPRTHSLVIAVALTGDSNAMNDMMAMRDASEEKTAKMFAEAEAAAALRSAQREQAAKARPEQYKRVLEY